MTNPDPELPMTNIVIEDRFPKALSPNNYYTVTGVKAKILKVNAKDEPLSGARIRPA